MTSAELAAAHVAQDYYTMQTGFALNKEQQDKLREIMENGISASEVMDAVDDAIARHGLCGYARDYWETVVERCRETWTKLHKKAAP